MSKVFSKCYLVRLKVLKIWMDSFDTCGDLIQCNNLGTNGINVYILLLLM